MEPSEVRRRVLRDHDSLRTTLEEVERLAEEVIGDEAVHVGRLRRAATELLHSLCTHMSWEDRYLVPALREADAWGPERVARLAADHVAQRRDIEHLLAELEDRRQPAPFLAGRVIEWIHDLHADMLDEESAFLDANLLRDDVVGIDVEAG